MKLPWKFRIIHAWRLLAYGEDIRFDACLEALESEAKAHTRTEIQRDRYQDALEEIRKIHPIPSDAWVIATEALDPEGCADLALIPKP